MFRLKNEAANLADCLASVWFALEIVVVDSGSTDDRYSSWEAAARRKRHTTDEKSLRATPFETALERKRWLGNLAARAPFRPGLRFLYHNVWRQGFRDGYRCWVLCRLLAVYERMIVSKERELKKRSRVANQPMAQR